MQRSSSARGTHFGAQRFTCRAWHPQLNGGALTNRDTQRPPALRNLVPTATTLNNVTLAGKLQAQTMPQSRARYARWRNTVRREWWHQREHRGKRRVGPQLHHFVQQRMHAPLHFVAPNGNRRGYHRPLGRSSRLHERNFEPSFLSSRKPRNVAPKRRAAICISSD